MWQPIETAPKDGMDWLTGWCEGYPPLPLIWFETEWATPDEAHTSWETRFDDGLYRWPEQPTHWMPLPDPPASGG